METNISELERRVGTVESQLRESRDILAMAIQTIQILVERLNMVERQFSKIHHGMPRHGGYDLVRFDTVSLFVPMHDNLYNSFLPAECKGFTIEQHYELMRTETPFADDALRSDVTKLLYLYMDILFGAGIGVHLLDIGAWIGDVAIRLAKYAKLRGAKFHAECFDPSFAGTLIPFNIELNDVRDRVTFKPIGVSDCGGPQIFNQVFGNSDGSQLLSGDGDGRISETYLVRTVTLADCLPEHAPDTHVMVKIDVEGIDAKLVAQARGQLADATLIIEFAPAQEQYRKIAADQFLSDLQTSHTLFDIYYCPRPTRAAIVRDPQEFIEDVRHRPFGYTDVLAVPKSLGAHDDIVRQLSRLTPIEPSLMMA
ncbi:MAG: FkbM family methyltransferase [Magnetospirillum sp.]|nr:FkbM family methyltransferase [Magnetospirillum sp.]